MIDLKWCLSTTYTILPWRVEFPDSVSMSVAVCYNNPIKSAYSTAIWLEVAYQIHSELDPENMEAINKAHFPAQQCRIRPWKTAWLSFWLTRLLERCRKWRKTQFHCYPNMCGKSHQLHQLTIASNHHWVRLVEADSWQLDPALDWQKQDADLLFAATTTHMQTLICCRYLRGRSILFGQKRNGPKVQGSFWCAVDQIPATGLCVYAVMKVNRLCHDGTVMMENHK